MVKKLSLLVFSLIFLELFLQVFGYFSPRVAYLLSREQPRWVPDQTLGFRPYPSFTEHDAKGFRNKVVPKKACIVALGDSQTYGWKVQTSQAWPQRLGSLAKVPVYNMAVPQYGPVHSLLLWKEALKVKPKLILEGFYVGNDLFDSYDMVYNRGMVPKLKSGNQVVIQAIAAAGKFEFDPTPFQPQHKEKHGSLRAFLAEHSKLYGLFRAIRRAYYYNFVIVEEDIHFANDWEKIKEMAREKDEYFIFDNGRVKTVLDTGTRSRALDLGDPRIGEGLRISLDVFRLMNGMARTSGVKFAVVLIPTKELVFKDILYSDSKEISSAYRTMIEREEQIWQKTTKFLTENDIYFIEALPALRKALLSGKQPYPISANGHKNSVGHEVVANLVLSRIETDLLSILEPCRGEGGGPL